MTEIRFCGKDYEVRTRNISFSEVPSWSAEIDAPLNYLGGLSLVTRQESEEAAIEALKELLEPYQEDWEKHHPHWGEIPDGVVLGEAVDTPCHCGGVMHRSNVPGTVTCARCGESRNTIDDSRIRRGFMSMWAKEPEQIAIGEAIEGMFIE